jgi:NAD(P)-dependent dehydrogenase (short-subunit alcohol dehydrogenase family)
MSSLEGRSYVVTGAAAGIGAAITELPAAADLIVADENARVVAFLLGDSGAAFTGSPVVMAQGWSAR